MKKSFKRKMYSKIQSGMVYKNLGCSGLKVSRISLGSWINYDGDENQKLANECIATAFSNGINFFDTAECYGHGLSEISIGKAIKEIGMKRERIVVSTKLFWGEEDLEDVWINERGLSRKHVVEGMYASLKRLQLDYVDVVFAHRPDSETPMEETVRAFDWLIQQGYAFYWGTSEWSAAEITEAYHIAKRENLTPPIVEQPEYNLLCRERVEKEYAPLYEKIGLGTTIWSPLKYGILSGKYSQKIPSGSRGSYNQRLISYLATPEGKRAVEICDKLAPIAEELNCDMAQLSLAWCLKNSNITSVITGASKPEQILKNIESLNIERKITDNLNTRIESILQNKPTQVLNARYK